MTEQDVDADAESPPRWGVVDLLVAFVVAQVASAIALAMYVVVRGLPTNEQALRDQLGIGEIALLQIPLWLGLLGVPLVATRRRGNGARRDLGLWMRREDVVRGVLIGIACQIALVPLVSIPLLWLSGADRGELEAPARELTDKATGWGVLVLALVVIVAAPLAEEVFFRGMLQRTLRRRLSSWPATFVTAVLFGASHFQALQFPALVAFGVVLSRLAEKDGRLGRCIWAHVGFNAVTVVALVAA